MVAGFVITPLSSSSKKIPKNQQKSQRAVQIWVQAKKNEVESEKNAVEEKSVGEIVTGVASTTFEIFSIFGKAVVDIAKEVAEENKSPSEVKDSLETGDQILTLNNKVYSTDTDVAAALRSLDIGSKIQFGIMREGYQTEEVSMEDSPELSFLPAQESVVEEDNDSLDPSAQETVVNTIEESQSIEDDTTEEESLVTVAIEKPEGVLGVRFATFEGIVKVNAISDGASKEAKEKLSLGDAIVSMNGLKYSDDLVLAAAIRSLPVGEKIEFSIRRPATAVQDPVPYSPPAAPASVEPATERTLAEEKSEVVREAITSVMKESVSEPTPASAEELEVTYTAAEESVSEPTPASAEEPKVSYTAAEVQLMLNEASKQTEVAQVAVQQESVSEPTNASAEELEISYTAAEAQLMLNEASKQTDPEVLYTAAEKTNATLKLQVEEGKKYAAAKEAAKEVAVERPKLLRPPIVIREDLSEN
eukprot:CAMPEP_0117887684 /NCGR_PEP_ID=MMETSP0950-20121206/21313_1 /TAXON_ID=44440 /ORGANISM="Chattonella subsalsa, Strain CCMP2191" /LENGTH=474 /DNA_ID=CAMNT_0005745671 /DNA_START=105 /DNA_END=1529 /DNA_ORIENTATION=-